MEKLSATSLIRSACTVALHMHQPLLPAVHGTSSTAELVSNLHAMLSSESDGDRYNARVYLDCYRRIGHIVPELVGEGLKPRIMLDYSGTLLWGLELMGQIEVLDDLRKISGNSHHADCVEWLGTAWGHPHAPSTRDSDFRLHLAEWRSHFASIFGPESLDHVKGFSPPEMAIPNHPDDAYMFVKSLRDYGYEWLLVQEHTVELSGDIDEGRPLKHPHIPHLLVCRNSGGAAVSIPCLVKTQGSDTKLVGQMQPYFEAKGLSRMLLGGREAPPIVTQIADGENGGVMMNEFPSKYRDVVRESSGSETPLMSGSEYFQLLRELGITEKDFPQIQPAGQGRLWKVCTSGCGPEEMTRVITKLQTEIPGFSMQGGSWTAHISWVKGYEGLLAEIDKLSDEFNRKAAAMPALLTSPEYQDLRRKFLTTQTSCFRYWGQGIWTDYGQTLCRMVREALDGRLRIV